MTSFISRLKMYQAEIMVLIFQSKIYGTHIQIVKACRNPVDSPNNQYSWKKYKHHIILRKKSLLGLEATKKEKSIKRSSGDLRAFERKHDLDCLPVNGHLDLLQTTVDKEENQQRENAQNGLVRCTNQICIPKLVPHTDTKKTTYLPEVGWVSSNRYCWFVTDIKILKFYKSKWDSLSCEAFHKKHLTFELND
ncbi:hypothetical protein PHYBLDRAFT_173718 [Phycomyces blakesleeanus NRRL 1555(-)]|uniref:Uncharacterized protein n=1 Tax=Phycomyces blakesleeanus (strain ATCC 8743b / DSM 1359 / FGSC 10004 / NBRC 33097 / NRRL 1555) TaxID=763407 RepID=A0A162ZMD3_PHYB8|nr:hypothetical protein PHYBLDRAFT_173718 [Phycomyces blakesleeanus NRRL 1555(-)]OAD67801.1 hypothetical protein PHYBLDRAFT_173718 [Phycomyces blakesleeanus NRRL 1555(-)]|eukprot:XP_018285841.1 hypothetical protein PHYBLDRAFT_173718 [Phycomyces blakesleeanus NRRL 1555(-)]